MKWLLISLAIGLAASDKLDRTYLPPPGAKFSGGNLGHHDAPLQPPHYTHSGSGPIVGEHEESHNNFGVNGEPVDFGDKIPKVPFNYYSDKVPITTTSYAFSQTTTYPPGESYETTALPINPITGLPVQLDQANYPVQGQSIQNLPGYTQNQGQVVPTYGTNVQPGFVHQGPTSGPIIYDSPNYDPSANQQISQYPGQNVIIPGGTAQIPGSVYQTPGQNQDQIQYPGGQSNMDQKGILPTGNPGDQRFDQYPGQNVIIPGDTVPISGDNQGYIQYPGGQTIPGQQGWIPSFASPASLQPGSSKYSVSYDGSKGPIFQGNYSGQPINIQNLDEYQLSEGQYPTKNQNLGGSENVYQPESTSTIPSTYYNGVSSTTSNGDTGVPSSTSTYSSVRPAYRPERPQAAADRKAVILNYENVRTPNGYSYSFDTSNGIHADESGIVDNGTKAQGSYSYTGDDGKVYSVFYTADENGFQPRGDHLPTPPPIPEAIQRVIEQAARDKAAGIVDDGSYDEAKYGDNKYQGVTHTRRRRPQNQDGDRLNNKQLIGVQDGQVKPVAGINDADYDEGLPQDQFQNLAVMGIRKTPVGTLPSNQINGENNSQDISEGNRRVSSEDGTTFSDLDDNGMPISEKGIHQFNSYGAKKQESFGNRPVSRGDNMPFIDTEVNNQGNLFDSKNRRPLSGGKYSGSQIADNGARVYPETNGNIFNDKKDQDIDSGSPNLSGRTDENISNNLVGITGTPIMRKQNLSSKIKGNIQPGTTSNNYNQNKKGRPHSESLTQDSMDTPSISDYITNAAKQPIPNQQRTQQDETGYHYQQPNSKFEHNKFPTRFSTQEVSASMKPDQRRTEYVTGTTRRPFITPNVYNQNYGTRQSTTRRPFMTIGVTSPTVSSDTDYEDGEDYATDEDIEDDKTDSTRVPIVKTTSRPNQSTQTTSRPKYTPGDRRTQVTQNGNVSGDNIVNSGNISPGYTFKSTTLMPSQGSRFGSTETPLKMKPQQSRPSTTALDSTTAVGRPVTPLGMGTSDDKYPTTRPVSTLVPGYETTDSTYPSSPQSYFTSTYRPSQGYPSTTTVPPTSGYKQDSGSQFPSKTPGLSQPSPTETFTGYHYEPPKSEYSTTGSSLKPDLGYFTPSGTPGVSPTSPPGTYHTSYQQGSGGFPSTTLIPLTPERQRTFILSQPGNNTSESSPFGIYQDNFNNPTSMVSLTPGDRPVFEYPGTSGVTIAQETTDYENGPSRPTYSTTDSLSTVGSTPGSFIPSGTPTQDYSSTYRPGFQTTKNTFISGPVVDGFGRPITTEQGGSHPEFSHFNKGSIEPNFGGTDQSTAYPGSYDPRKVIGEDFSGPKQPQRYDPKTGYHYK